MANEHSWMGKNDEEAASTAQIAIFLLKQKKIQIKRNTWFSYQQQNIVQELNYVGWIKFQSLVWLPLYFGLGIPSRRYDDHFVANKKMCGLTRRNSCKGSLFFLQTRLFPWPRSNIVGLFLPVSCSRVFQRGISTVCICCGVSAPAHVGASVSSS